MADDTKNATLRSKMKLGTRVARDGYTAIVIDSTVEAAAAASAGSVYTMMRIPTNARIHNLSEMSWDDLASSGSPTLDIGFSPVDGNFTLNATALNDGLDAATATTSAKVVK